MLAELLPPAVNAVMCEIFPALYYLIGIGGSGAFMYWLAFKIAPGNGGY